MEQTSDQFAQFDPFRRPRYAVYPVLVFGPHNEQKQVQQKPTKQREQQQGPKTLPVEELVFKKRLERRNLELLFRSLHQAGPACLPGYLREFH